jgi:predicted nucleotide-binding protein (sugar kinase/HSP70/actin superfamily)
VVEDRRIGDNIFYQGATAANRGIVAAFEAVIGKKITVPPHHDVTGAIGAAILACKERTWETSRFKGFELADRKYSVSSFECKACPNNCEIRQVKIEGEEPLLYGGRCEKYEVKSQQQQVQLPDLFQEREALLYGPEPLPEGPRGPIGLPRTMFFQELAPFFRAFFEDLGFTVVYSQKSNKSVIRRGVECMAAETCFPIKVAHGHILDLLESGVKKIFLPSIVDMQHPHPEVGHGVVCPLVQTLAYTVPSAINFAEHGAQLYSPVLHFGRGHKELRRSLKVLTDQLGISSFALNRALRRGEEAQAVFYQALQQRGREIVAGLAPDEVAMVIVSRPYNGFDAGLNLNLPRKLRQLGILAIPMDFLPLDDPQEIEEIKPMYWRYGQKILAAADLIRLDPRLYAVYVTNFSCGPDSFIQHFFKERMRGKPYLEIEIDEHSSDVGAITRLEAFLDSLRNVNIQPLTQKTSPHKRRVTQTARRKIFVPPMTDHALALVAAFEACGAEAELLPESDEETLIQGRRLTSGKECYPLILTTGDMAKLLGRSDFNPDRSAFFMPSGDGPCRFGQYHRFHRLILDDLGYPHVPVFAPDQTETLYQEVGMVGDDFSRISWRGIAAIDLLEKKLRETRPYEKKLGDADQVYDHHLQKVYQSLRDRGDTIQALRQARHDFDHVSLNGSGEKPIIGIVGEIYTRANKFANENAVREIEALGGEAWMAPIGEWLLYVNFTAKRRAWKQKKLRLFLEVFLTEWVQIKEEHRLEEVFRGGLKNLGEPSIAETMANAKGYLDPSFEGEAILSIGKSKDFFRKGVAGLVNIMPFTCMPGTVVNALFKRFREEHDNIPFLNLAYDGQEQTNTRTRLEAFMYQVRQFKENRRKL